MYKVLTAPDSELSSYDNVIADGKTAIIVSESGELVKEQADEALFWLPEALPRAHRKGFTNEQEDEKRTRMLSERASELHARRSDIPVLDPDFNYIYMLHPFGWHAFGHLFDSLQRLRHAVPAVPKPWKVLHSHNRQVVDFEVHMEKLGVPRDSLIEILLPALQGLARNGEHQVYTDVFETSFTKRFVSLNRIGRRMITAKSGESVRVERLSAEADACDP